MAEMTATLSDMQETRPRQYRGWLQVVAIVLLLEIGGVLGALTGFIPLSPIMSVVLPLAAAWYFLKSEGTPWRSLVFGTQLSLKALAGYTAIAAVGATVLVMAAETLMVSLGMPAPDYSGFRALLEGNTVMYLWFLIPVAWGSAAIGEELLVRGFLLHRLEGLSGTFVALVLQALIFAVAHFYQGITGVVCVFIVALVFGAVYLRCGRALLPLILAHGLIDTVGITAFYIGFPGLSGS